MRTLYRTSAIKSTQVDMSVFQSAGRKVGAAGEHVFTISPLAGSFRRKVVKTRGLDKPLAFPGEYKGRRITQYSKGALFPDHLRAVLGDEMFWAGIRAYTQEHAGGTVTSIDFKLRQTSHQEA